MKKKYVTLVGSRDMPSDVKGLLGEVGGRLAMDGFHGRSGFADGADIEFFKGYLNEGLASLFTNYMPWWKFRSNEEPLWHVTEVKDTFKLVPSAYLTDATEIASGIHPAWHRCTRGPRALHTRNVCQVLGDDLATPSKVLYCYVGKVDKHGDPTGGTRTAWMLAKKYNIPCRNLAEPAVMESCLKWLGR